MFRKHMAPYSARSLFDRLGDGDWSRPSLAATVASMAEPQFCGPRQWRKPEPCDDTPMAVNVDADAAAFGVDTLASGDVDATVKDYGRYSVACGTIDFRAAAEGPDSFARVETFVDISGADIVFIFKETVTGLNFEVERTKFFALDFDWIDLADNPIEMIRETERSVRCAFDVADGNVALADFDVEALADDSYVDVTTDVLAIEDTASLSLISAFATIG